MGFGGCRSRNLRRNFCYCTCNKKPLAFLLTFFPLIFIFFSYKTLLSPNSTHHRLRNYIAISTSEERSAYFPVTIITAFFDFSTENRSKHSLAEYHKWHQNFFPIVSTPMVIFTQPSQLSRISGLRNGKPTKFHVYNEIWELPWIAERNSSLREAYEKQHKIDAEWSYHSPELYAVWNSKAWMASFAAESNPFNSSFFFWVDSGSARYEMPNILQNFPETWKVSETFDHGEDASDKLLMFAVEKFHKEWKPEEDYAFGEKSVVDMIDGGFFGGRKEAVMSLASDLISLHDTLLEQNKFVGKDQDLYNRLALQWPERYMIVCSCEENWLIIALGVCSDWMYYLSWFGAKENNNYCNKVKVKGMMEFLGN